MLLIRNPGENYSRMVGGDLMLGWGGQRSEERIEFILRSKQSEEDTGHLSRGAKDLFGI